MKILGLGENFGLGHFFGFGAKILGSGENFWSWRKVWVLVKILGRGGRILGFGENFGSG